MFYIFDSGTTYTLPSGRTLTGDALKNEDAYRFLTDDRIWCCDVSDGVLKSFQLLSDLKDEYGVEDSDTQTALTNINSIRTRNAANDALVKSSASVVLKAASFAALSFTDEQALEVPDLYPVYEVDHAYKKDERFTYNGRLFKVNQDHTSAAQWVPGETDTESLYTCLEMAGDGYLVWTHPTGAHTAYHTADVVHSPTADDPRYQSLIDGTTWSPEAYPQGWELYTES